MVRNICIYLFLGILLKKKDVVLGINEEKNLLCLVFCMTVSQNTVPLIIHI